MGAPRLARDTAIVARRLRRAMWIVWPLCEETLMDVSPTAQSPESFRHPTVATVEQGSSGSGVETVRGSEMSTETATSFETERLDIGHEAPALSRALV